MNSKELKILSIGFVVMAVIITSVIFGGQIITAAE